MAADIGSLLFVDFLRMSNYPGSPFTGNLFQDLILFLIVPTIFIIMVLYIATGRIIPDKKMRVMLGVGAYLFILASGYYTAFAQLAGPYFIFLIFILGLLGFITGHFRRGGHGGGAFASHSYDSGGGYSSESRSKSSILRMGAVNPIKSQRLDDDLVSIYEAINLAKAGAKDVNPHQLTTERTRLEIERWGKRLSNAEVKRKYGIELR